eukprot:GGOE01062125.1.p1 GENE.GGOE01062125.1~~GGOE01062125.1.p1  ORF type:complete len:615 (-),score=176.37 GGOE01062125.1:232-2076(-)
MQADVPGKPSRGLSSRSNTTSEEDPLCTQVHVLSVPEEATQPSQAWGKLTDLDRPTDTFVLATTLGEIFTIGRQPGCHIRIRNTKISAVHCQLSRIALPDGTLQSVIQDFSTNGTLLNGKRLLPKRVYKLHSGDEITFVQARAKQPRLSDASSCSSGGGESFGGFIFQALYGPGPPEAMPVAPAEPGPPGKKAPIRFRKGELLGQGGFGQVYLGMDMGNGKLIAVKQVDCRHLSTESELRQLKEEISLLKALSHPRIVHYLGFSQAGTKFSILLEYVPGGSIRSLLSKFGKFEESVISSYTNQLLHGLQYLHSCGVIHRDIKAANVLVSDLGEIKVSDFGACYKRSSGPCDASKLWGTPLWMAPESVRSSWYSSSSDIWGLGCTVLEMATGTLPWAELQLSTVEAVLFHLGQCSAPPLIPTTVPPLTADFIGQCLQMDPFSRPSIPHLLQHSLMTTQALITSSPCKELGNGVPDSPAHAVEVERQTVGVAVVLSLRPRRDDTTGSGEYTYDHAPVEGGAAQLSQHCSFLHHRAHRAVHRSTFSDGSPPPSLGHDAVLSAALREVNEWLQEEPSTTSDDIQEDDLTAALENGRDVARSPSCAEVRKRLFSHGAGE